MHAAKFVNYYVSVDITRYCFILKQNIDTSLTFLQYSQLKCIYSNKNEDASVRWTRNIYYSLTQFYILHRNIESNGLIIKTKYVIFKCVNYYSV